MGKVVRAVAVPVEAGFSGRLIANDKTERIGRQMALWFLPARPTAEAAAALVVG